MPVKLISGGKLVPSLTSPPEHPDPYPPDELIAKKISYGDRDILITIPFPDTVELITDLYNHHLMSTYATGASPKWTYTKIDQEMMEWAEGLKTKETFSPISAKVFGSEKRTAIFMIGYDEAQPLSKAKLTVARRTGDNYPVWSIRLEFSARKAGHTGLLKLISLMDDVLPCVIPRVLGTMQVSRVDPAIDLIGIEPLDVIAHIQNPGKRMVYVGDHGRPESLYLYQAKKALTEPPKSITYNTRGTLRLTLYDRKAYNEQLMLVPPHGPCKYTRAEVVKRWTKGRPYLADLADIPNAFLGRRVAYAAALAPSSGSAKAWVQFCLAAFGGGVRKSQSKSSVGQGLKFRRLYEECAGDLVNEEMWAGWPAGLAYTGLTDWIDIASANHPIDLH